MKYEKAIKRVESRTMSRNDLMKLKKNADTKLMKGDKDAQYVLKAINTAVPADSYILFMGFCPDANADNRLDVEWKEKGICRFDYTESEQQLNRFNNIYSGDLVVLKKRKKFGKTMELFGYGRVKSVVYDDNNVRYFNMDWSDQEEIIEVPLMGCNSTVDVKAIEQVNDEMPEEFFKWLDL